MHGKRFWQFMMVAMLSLGLAALAGCASMVPGMPDAQRDIRVLQERQDAADAAILKKAERVDLTATQVQLGNLAAAQEATAGLLKKTAEALGTKANKAEVAELAARTDKAVGALTERADKTDGSVKALEASQARTDQAVAATGRNVAALGARVNGLNSQVSKVRERVANSEHAALIGDGVRVIPIYGFPRAQYDDGKKEFTACGELSGQMKKELDERVVPLVMKLHWNMREVRGLASIEKFRGPGGKVHGKSDELNSLCALQRAKAVAVYLAEATQRDILAIGVGITTDYGAHDQNRAVNVVLEIQADKRAVEVVSPKPAPAPAPPAPAKP